MTVPSSSLPAIPLPVNDPSILDYRQQALAIRDEASALRVDSPETKTAATSFLGRVARLQREAETKRGESLCGFTKGVNELFRQTLGPIQQADQIVRGKVLEFDVAQRRAAAQAAAKAERERLEAEALLHEAERAEAAGKATVADNLLSTAVSKDESAKTAATQAAPIAKTTRTETGSAATVRKIWTFKVVDLGQVPREYLVLNETKVREAIRAGAREIPGLEIFEQESLSVRA